MDLWPHSSTMDSQPHCGSSAPPQTPSPMAPLSQGQHRGGAGVCRALWGSWGGGHLGQDPVGGISVGGSWSCPEGALGQGFQEEILGEDSEEGPGSESPGEWAGRGEGVPQKGGSRGRESAALACPRGGFPRAPGRGPGAAPGESQQGPSSPESVPGVLGGSQLSRGVPGESRRCPGEVSGVPEGSRRRPGGGR